MKNSIFVVCLGIYILVPCIAFGRGGARVPPVSRIASRVEVPRRSIAPRVSGRIMGRMQRPSRQIVNPTLTLPRQVQSLSQGVVPTIPVRPTILVRKIHSGRSISDSAIPLLPVSNFTLKQLDLYLKVEAVLGPLINLLQKDLDGQSVGVILIGELPGAPEFDHEALQDLIERINVVAISFTEADRTQENSMSQKLYQTYVLNNKMVWNPVNLDGDERAIQEQSTEKGRKELFSRTAAAKVHEVVKDWVPVRSILAVVNYDQLRDMRLQLYRQGYSRVPTEVIAESVSKLKFLLTGK